MILRVLNGLDCLFFRELLYVTLSFGSSHAVAETQKHHWNFKKNIPHLICVSTTFSREVMFEKTLGFLLWFQVGTSTVGHGFGQGHPKRMVVYWKNLFFNR